MTNEMLIEIGQLFITFLSQGTAIAVIFYFIKWIVNLLLGMIFPSRYSI